MADSGAGADRLARYRAKRSAGGTPEPFGTGAERGAAESRGRLFVVHKHAARRLHYDLRLEMDGVLQSWAVPRGPSRNPSDKRLAVMVEDHPLEYADFEGLIPEGNYGAGASIVWDRGVWVPIGDPAEGIAAGKLLFDLQGYKLRGRWTLVKLKKGDNEWLLIKEKDALASDDGDDFPEGSVLSGLTVEEVREGKAPAAAIREALREAGAKEKRVSVDQVELMLAETREDSFSRAGWVYELKYDGYRMLAAREGGEPRLVTRNGNDATGTFPELARAVGALPFDGLILDGEVVVHDETGRPSFQRLQKRGRLTRPMEIRRAAIELPAAMYVFDLLACEGYDVRPLPLVERKKLLKRVLPAAGPLKYADHVEEQGDAFYEQVVAMQLEGMVGKRGDSAYRGGRSPHWIKVRSDRADDFVVIGFTKSKGGRGGFGALHLGGYENGELVYAGRVGTGFTSQQLDEIRATLDRIRRPASPASGAPADADGTWVEPELVCEVRYKEWTEDGLLRQPVFLRFRDDKPPSECVLKGRGGDGGEGDGGRGGAAEGAGARGGGRRTGTAVDEPVPTEPAAHYSAEKVVQFSNLDKVFWPEEGYTKGDLIEYYRAITPWVLPYLRDRLVVMTRFPDGIDGKSFFQKDAPGFAPEWLRREVVWSDESQRDLNYFVAEDEPSLLYIANMASIPLHIWASRVATLELPDWCSLDLDPKEAPFTDVVEVARTLKQLCDDIALPCFIKTTGSSGLHVMVPLGRQVTHDQARTLGELLARVVVAERPDVATLARHVSRREGKVYVDYLQNGRGKLLVAPFSVRPLPGAPVSTPLAWQEVTATLDIRKHTIRTVPRRMEELKDDPLRPVLEVKPDLASALGRLKERLG